MWLSHFLLLVSAFLYYAEANKFIVCEYSSWSGYRLSLGKFEIEDIDPSLCTHINYDFAGLDPTNYRIKVLDAWADLCTGGGKCGYDRIVKLKQKNPDLKTLLTVGGYNEGSTYYSYMAEDPAKRKTFIDSTIELLKEHGFDGLNMEWEYPTMRGGRVSDKANFVTLLSELSAALKAQGKLLTASVSALAQTVAQAYDVPGISKYLDLINLMSYDFHGSWEIFTHHSSSLYQNPDDSGDAAYLNQDYAVSYWIKQGAPAEKLVLGLPAYGHTWKLDKVNETGFNAPASHTGTPGPYTQQGGILGYNEICEFQGSEKWTVVHDPKIHEPYAYCISHDQIWVAYEDPDSYAIKAQYALDKGLAGCMVSAIDTDDFLGQCQSETFPLLRSINKVFKDTTTPASDEAPTSSTIPSHEPDTKVTSSLPVSTMITSDEPHSEITPSNGPMSTIITSDEPNSEITPSNGPISTMITSNEPDTTASEEPMTTAIYTTHGPVIISTMLTTKASDPCTKLGPNPEPQDCTHYYMCSMDFNDWVAQEMPCPPGTLFNPEALVCDIPLNVCALDGDPCPNDCPAAI